VVEMVGALARTAGRRLGGSCSPWRLATVATGGRLLAQTVLLGYLDADAALEGTVGWEAWLGDAEPPPLTFTPLAFDHPLWVLYSSGTTGLPKAIVHGQGGILLEQLKQLGLHADARAGDRLLWFTTTGWMMWNFLVGGLLTGAEIVLYDGNPSTPDLSVLWELASRTRATTFGTSAAFLASCRKAGLTPAADHDLGALRAVGSTGSPLSPEAFEWVYEEVGADLWLYSTSGGTDVCTAFVDGVPILPVRRGELQARALGCAVAAWDEEGRELVGEVGELVITQPMPSMPLFFWNDPSGQRLREAYFETYPGVWRHGDWIEITPRGSAVIYGRSDSTINRGGVRMGTAEIYRAVLAGGSYQRVTDPAVAYDAADGVWLVSTLALAEDASGAPSDAVVLTSRSTDGGVLSAIRSSPRRS